MRIAAEDVIAHALEDRPGSVPLGRTRVVLDRDVYDPTGWPAWLRGPHTVGVVEQAVPGEIKVRLVNTRPGREAAALLEDDLVDIRVGPVIHLE